MEFSKEEKKAIENLKNILVDLEDAENGGMIYLSQEEINSLKSILEILKSSISKDKIREKIKELETTRNSSVTDNGFTIMSVVISNFKELLEGN